MVEKLLTVGFHHRLRTLPGMTRFGGAHPPKNPQPPNAASLLPQNSLKILNTITAVVLAVTHGTINSITRVQLYPLTGLLRTGP